MRDHDLSRARHHEPRIKRSILTTTLGPGHNQVRKRVTQTTSRAPFASSQPAFGRRLGAEGYCDPKPIRPRSISPADEGYQLSRQDREAPRRAGYHSQLEHHRKNRKNSGRKSLMNQEIR